MDSPSMRDYIKNFSLDNGPRGNQGYSRVLLQLFGFTGHGKSSFINSCKYVVDDGPYTAHAKVAGSAEKPETMIRKAYNLTETITLVDNRGCVKMSKEETGEIYAQLGLVPTVVVTHKLSEHLPDIQEKFRRMGVDNIYPIENYTAKDRLKTRGKHEGILKCLYEIMRDVEFRMKEPRNPSTEKIERKRILLDFAHKRDLEKSQEREASERARVKEAQEREASERARANKAQEREAREHARMKEAQEREARERARMKEAQEEEARERARREALERELERKKRVLGVL